MSIKMPELEVGRTYSCHEVMEYQAPNDFSKVMVRFPYQDIDKPETDLLRYRPDEEMVLEFAVVPVAGFARQLDLCLSNLVENKADQERVQTILTILGERGIAYPVLVQKGDLQHRIREGNHRLVALLQLNVNCIPVFFMKYPDW